jgi:hypothetical protein
LKIVFSKIKEVFAEAVGRVNLQYFFQSVNHGGGIAGASPFHCYLEVVQNHFPIRPGIAGVEIQVIIFLGLEKIAFHYINLADFAQEAGGNTSSLLGHQILGKRIIIIAIFVIPVSALLVIRGYALAGDQNGNKSQKE